VSLVSARCEQSKNARVITESRRDQSPYVVLFGPTDRSPEQVCANAAALHIIRDGQADFEVGAVLSQTQVTEQLGTGGSDPLSHEASLTKSLGNAEPVRQSRINAARTAQEAGAA
jgi:hypothetical protein